MVSVKVASLGKLLEHWKDDSLAVETVECLVDELAVNVAALKVALKAAGMVVTKAYYLVESKEKN